MTLVLTRCARCRKIQFTVFDMAGGSKYRSMWGKYYKGAEGIVYVIDSADAMRLCAPTPPLGQHPPAPACPCFICPCYMRI